MLHVGLIFVQWHWKRIIQEQRLRTYFDQKLILHVDVCSGQLKWLIDKKQKGFEGYYF